ncbi:MAG: glycosyltransferase family 4 protein [Chloroflexi bacterium]|nr:glycosyltransferase family 4 protein [Chloroflexota bacterium]
MRVLFITGEYPPMQGGVGDYTREIAHGLAAHGAEVRVLTSQLATTNYQLPITNRQFSIRPIIAKWNWSSLRVISNYVRDFAPDIVNIQYQTGAYAMHPAINFLPRMLRFPFFPSFPKFVVTFHDLRIPYLFPKAGPLREWVTRELARSCHAVIATNAEDYSKLSPFNLRLLTCIPIGSNIPTIEPQDYRRSEWRAQLGVSDGELLLCHFGFVNARKGCDTLVRALAMLPNAKLLMMGGQTGASDPTNVAQLAQLQSLIAELGLTERVRWTGYTPPEVVTANFRAADLCVLPYREGASYQHGTLMAALAHAMPIVTTASPPTPLPPPPSPGTKFSSRRGGRGTEGEGGEVTLSDSHNCLLVSPDDPHALAQAIQRAAGSPELRARLSRGACDLAQHFTWYKIVQQYLELFNHLTI